MFAEGPDGFKGGLSARNYRTISEATSATATRDLAGLVDLGALRRAGERKSTRYYLAIDDLRSEEHTSELQSLMRISYAVFCLKKKKKNITLKKITNSSSLTKSQTYVKYQYRH